MAAPHRTLRRIAAAALIAGGVLVALLPPLSGIRQAAVRVVFAPAALFAGAGNAISKTWNGAPAGDAAALRAERDALVLENAKLRAASQEADELRALLDYRERARVELVPARIIGRSTDLAEQAVIIDRGTDDGLAPGMAVVAGDGFYLGTVRKAAPRTAVVVLALDSRNRVAAMIQNGARTIGYVEGGRGLGMALRLIPQDEKIEAGQMVVTSGLDPVVPRGLVVGRVERVSREPQDPFQTAVISQLMAAERQMTVAVVRTETPEAL